MDREKRIKERRFLIIVVVGIIFILSIGLIAKRFYRSSLEQTIKQEFIQLEDPNFIHLNAFVSGSKGIEYHFMPKSNAIYQRIMNNQEMFRSTVLFNSCEQNKREIHEGVKMYYKYYYSEGNDAHISLDDPKFLFFEINVSNETCTYLGLN